MTHVESRLTFFWIHILLSWKSLLTSDTKKKVSHHLLHVLFIEIITTLPFHNDLQDDTFRVASLKIFSVSVFSGEELISSNCFSSSILIKPRRANICPKNLKIYIHIYSMFISCMLISKFRILSFLNLYNCKELQWKSGSEQLKRKIKPLQNTFCTYAWDLASV